MHSAAQRREVVGMRQRRTRSGQPGLHDVLVQRQTFEALEHVGEIRRRRAHGRDRHRRAGCDRRAVLVDTVEKELGSILRIVGDPAGAHLVATFLNRSGDHQVAMHAARQGLWVMPLSSCYLGRPPRQGLVLGFGGTDVSDITSGVRCLSRILERISRPEDGVV